MDIYVSVSDNDHHLTLDGDLDLLDRLLSTLKSGRGANVQEQNQPTPGPVISGFGQPGERGFGRKAGADHGNG